MPEELGTPDLATLTRRAYACARAGDWEGVLSFYRPDTDWDMTAGGLGKYDGPEALLQFFSEWTGSYREWELELEEVEYLGDDKVLAVVLTRGRSGRRARWVELRFATIADWVGEHMTHVKSYTDIDEARAAAARIGEERRAAGL
jgi:hypothetical protein